MKRLDTYSTSSTFRVPYDTLGVSLNGYTVDVSDKKGEDVKDDRNLQKERVRC